MPHPLKVLIAVGLPSEAAPIVFELERAGFELDWVWVDSESDYLVGLERKPDLVVSDYHLPNFSGLRALELLKNQDPAVPLIFISGTIGEEAAVLAMQSGAADYLMMDRLPRLGAAVIQALAKAQSCRERGLSDTQLQQAGLRVLFDLIPAMVWFKDTKNRLLCVNQHAAKTAGRSVEEIEGQLARAVYPQETDQSAAADARVIRSGVPEHGTIETVRDSQGAEFTLQTDRVPVCDKAGVVQGIVVMSHDITERKRTEARLQLLSLAMEQSKAPMMITDADLDWPGPRIVFVNSAHFLATGYTAAEVIGKTPRILQGPLTDKAVLARLRDNLSRGEPFEGEVINYRKDGTPHILEWQIAPLSTSNGQVTHFVSVQHDNTARAQANAVLRANDRRFRAMFEQADLGVAQANAESGQLEQVNACYCKILGRSQEELEQLTCFAFTHPQDIAPKQETLRQLREGIISESAQELRYLRRDGSHVWVNVTISGLGAPGEKQTKVIAVVQDVTERKLLEEQLRQAQKMEAIGTLAGGIAHDFNNILAAIIGYTELAQTSLTLNPKVHSHLDAVLRASNRATDLIRQILTFSRQQPLKRRPIPLQPVVVEAVNLLRATIPATIDFDLSLSPDAPLVLADATQLHQILMNLGTNAWHAMKDQAGRLTVNLERYVIDTPHVATEPRLQPGIYALLSVSDTGCGMDPATLRQIFEPFFTTKPLGEGTGLGLSVVHGIMAAHDGAITVHSQVGVGTIFRLYFPIHLGVTIVVPPTPSPVPRGQGERILVVDDEEILALMIQEALVGLGYTVDYTTQPTVALAMVRAEPLRFALMLTDQTMPTMTGLQLATQLQSVRTDLPVVIMTGYNDALMAERTTAAGVSQLLLKPITLNRLGNAVHAALSSVGSRA